MNKENNVTCKEVMSHICESLGEDLQSERCTAIRNHLNECEGCQKYFKSIELTIGFYKSYNIELPEEKHNDLMKKLGLE